MKIKSLLTYGLMSLFLLFNFSFIIHGAYTPSTGDQEQIEQLITELDFIIDDNKQNLRDFYYQVKQLKRDYTYIPKVDRMLDELFGYLRDTLDQQKKVAQLTSKQEKQYFLMQYTGDITLQDDESLERCTGRYQTLDDMSFVYDLPTALTIATWYRETTCGYYLPYNGDGPFQIVGKEYGTGDITEDIFVQSVKDFLEFTQYKINRYEEVNNADVEPEYGINLSYTGFDLTGIVKFSALYNSLSGNTVYGHIEPKRPDYVFDGYGDEYSGATRYGIFPQFLKVLEREINNIY